MLPRTQPVYWAARGAPGPQMPPTPLWIQVTPPRGCPCWAEWEVGLGVYRASSDQQDVWMGQGGHQGGAGGTGSEGPDGVPGLHHRHGHQHQGLPSMPPSSSATLWGKGAMSRGEGCTLTRWNQVGAQQLGLASAPWDMPGPVGVWTATEHKKSLCSHLALDLASFHFPPYCQLPVPWGRHDLGPSCPTYPSLQAQTAQDMSMQEHPCKTGTGNFFTNFIQLEEVQFKKTEKFVSS